MKKFVSTTFAIAVFTTLAFSQNLAPKERGTDKNTLPAYRFLISTTYISVTNPFPNSVSMYELHFGYRITPRDVVAIKAATWRLFEPMGIPMGPHLQQESEFYPGNIREFGVGVSYQRFLWKGLFTSVQILPLKKIYLDENKNKVAEGFKLYTSYHLGYHIRLFKNRLFVEPQVHCNYWPINTKGPEGFEEKERKWNNYYLFEPNLFVGVNF